MANTQYTTKRAIPDTFKSVPFLNTMVREPDTNDWKKLAHLMKYLSKTGNLPLIMGAGGTGILKWWMDASFSVHPNMRGYIGGGISI